MGGKVIRHERARLLQPFLDLRRDAVAGLEPPFVEPHLQPVLAQPLRQWAHHRLVLRAVAEENVVLKLLPQMSEEYDEETEPSLKGQR